MFKGRTTIRGFCLSPSGIGGSAGICGHAWYVQDSGFPSRHLVASDTPEYSMGEASQTNRQVPVSPVVAPLEPIGAGLRGREGALCASDYVSSREVLGTMNERQAAS